MVALEGKATDNTLRTRNERVIRGVLSKPVYCELSRNENEKSKGDRRVGNKVNFSSSHALMYGTSNALEPHGYLLTVYNNYHTNWAIE